MAQIIPIGQIMRPDTFEVSVHDRAQFSHMVIFTDHIRERMQERDVSTRQVLNVLRKGSICEAGGYEHVRPQERRERGHI